MVFRIRPGQNGVAIRLHDFEAEIMDVVWSRKLRRFVEFCHVFHLPMLNFRLLAGHD